MEVMSETATTEEMYFEVTPQAIPSKSGATISCLFPLGGLGHFSRRQRREVTSGKH